MTANPVLTSLDARGVVTVTLNRPEVNNAYNGEMLHQIHAALDELGRTPTARVMVLKGSGRHFQAGADLTWIASLRDQSPEANLEASRETGSVVDRLNHLPIPVVTLVKGACFGGGTGIVAASDVVIAADSACFSIAEVRWGLHAGIIIPQLNDAMSVRQVRRYALTAERFGADEARRVGLVHEVVSTANLDVRGSEIVAQILENGPGAVAQTKAHILEHAWGGFDRVTFDGLAQSHADARQCAEAEEGLASFQDKRRAAWALKP